MRRFTSRLGLLAVALSILGPGPVEAQVIDRLKRRVAAAAEEQVAQEFEEIVRGAVRCVFDNLECIEKAKADGDTVVLTDAEGQILTNDEGRPYMDPSELPPELAPPDPPDSNYDFEPGDRVLFEEGFADENLGDFPRTLEFLQGNMQVVD